MTKNKVYHIISVFLLLGSVAVLFFCYPYTLERLVESVVDLIKSAVYYGAKVIKREVTYELTFLSLPDEKYTAYLPFSVAELQRKFQVFMPTLFNKDSFLIYVVSLINFVSRNSRLLLILLPLFLILPKLFMSIILAHNNKYGQDTKPLQFWKAHVERIWRIAYGEVKNFILWFYANKYYRRLFVTVWGICLNILPMLCGFVAYYLYFVVSFDLLSLPTQLIRILVDVLIMFNCGCVLLWVSIGYVILDKFRRNVGYNKLNHNEMKNRGFIKSLSIMSLICGTVGKFKTKLCTDMGVSQAIMFRGDAFEALRENDMKFPHFPWIIFEREFERAVEYDEIKDIFTCRAWLRKKRARFEKSPSIERLYGYDYTRYPMYWDSGLKLESLFEVIGYYVELYMIYIMDSSLLVANYSIRDDSYIYDKGNFPRWNTELFRRKSEDLEELSHYAHILDYDSVRLGRKLLDKNINMLARIGVYVLTEVGKERGNKVELEGKKKISDETNQKNDLFDYWYKFIRHLVTIYYIPFAKVFSDEQRADSLGINIRQLCDVIWIDERSGLYIVMPFFLLGDLFYDLVYAPFMKQDGLYDNYRFERGDYTLFMYLLKGVMHKFFSHYKRIYNIYGTYDLTLRVLSSGLESDARKHVYHISTKKDHADRYSTDCYSDVFDEVSSRYPYWINDIPTYQGVKATYEEMKSQNSYLFNDICDMTDLKK